MPETISHGWTTAEPDDPTKDVSQRNLNDHTISYSGLTAGQVLRASSAAAADFATIQDGDLPSTIARDSEVTSAVAAEAALARNADNLTSGTVADARIASTIARDSEVTSAISTHEGLSDPHPGYLTSAEGNAAYQPLDGDLTAIAALTTTSYGRSVLETANAAALRTLGGLVIGTDVQAQDAELAALAGLTSAADKVPYFSGSGTAAVADFTSYARTLVALSSKAAVQSELGVSSSVVPEDFWTPPDSAGAFDQELNGTADTLPSGWSWISTPSAWFLNSKWKRRLIVDHPASTGETKELEITFAPGAVDFGIWFAMAIGIGQWNNNQSWMDLYVMNSGETEAVGWRIDTGGSEGILSRSIASSVESNISVGPTTWPQSGYVFLGITRKTSDNTWRFYFSHNGISWNELGGAHTHGVTITPHHIQVRFESGSNVGVERHVFGPFRYRQDLLLWAPRS